MSQPTIQQTPHPAEHPTQAVYHTDPSTSADPAPTSAEVPPVDPTPTVDVRVQVIERLRLMTANFTIHAWERRFSDPLAPHCLAYLYLRRDPRRPGFWQLGTAWQLWLADPAVRILPRLLYDLHHTFAPRATGAGFDIREELAVGTDEHMRSGADEWVYIGLAAISLDTADTSWEQVQQTARLSLDVAAVLRIVLSDGTVMVCRQAGRTGLGTFTIQSNKPLAYGTARTLAPWTRLDLDEIYRRDHAPDALRWAAELSDTLSQADNGRIDALRQAAQKRGHRL